MNINKILLNHLLKCKNLIEAKAGNRKALVYWLRDMQVTLNTVGEFGDVSCKYYNDFCTIINYEEGCSKKPLFGTRKTSKQIAEEKIYKLIKEIEKHEL